MEGEDEDDEQDYGGRPIDWLEISAAMGGRRSRQQCLAKWNKMRVNLNKARVRQLLHGRQPDMSPELRVVLMQMYGIPDASLRRIVGAMATHPADDDRAFPWRALQNGKFAKELRAETLSILWARLRRGLPKAMRNRSDQECARRLFEMAEEGFLEGVLVEQENLEGEEELLKDPQRTVSTRASYRGGRG